MGLMHNQGFTKYELNRMELFENLTLTFVLVWFFYIAIQPFLFILIF